MPGPVFKVRVRRAAIMQWAARRNLPLKSVAVRLSMSPAYLSQLLGGFRNPSPKTRSRLLGALKPLSWDQLFEEKT